MSSTNRLAASAPDLVLVGDLLTSAARSAKARSIASWACDKTGATESFSAECTFLVRDPERVASQNDLQQLNHNIESWDERYFESDDVGNVEEALQWFSKARAAASLLYAIDAASLSDFCEALYEANAATDSLDCIRELTCK